MCSFAFPRALLCHRFIITRSPAVSRNSPLLCVATMFKFTLHHFWLYISDVSLACYISHPAHLVFFSPRFAKPCCATTISCKSKGKRFRAIPSLPGHVGISFHLLLLVLLLLVFCFAKLGNAELEPPRNISVAVSVLQCRHCYASCVSNVLCTCCYATAVVSSEFRIVLVEFHPSCRRRRRRRFVAAVAVAVAVAAQVRAFYL